MLYLSHSVMEPSVQEPPVPYLGPSSPGCLYEVSLRTPLYSTWLGELQGAHRLIQTLFQGQLLGYYDLVDAVVWSEGFFARVSLKEGSSLSGFLKFLKERTVPSGEPTSAYWVEEPRWLRLIPQERRRDSDRHFQETARQVRERLDDKSPGLFFYYRDQRSAS